MAYVYPNEESLVSKGLYRIVIEIIEPDCIVKLRQQGWKLSDIFESIETSRSLLMMISGSMAEGYNFHSSDYDFMGIDRNVLVLTCNASFALNKTDIPTVVIMETENVLPGFTLLRCIRWDHRNEKLYKSLVMRGNGFFVSSEIARKSHLSGSGSVVHGPCQSGVLLGREYDIAYTLKNPFWPKEAKSFIYRSLRHGWPCFDVLQDICQDGCLLVPINSKQQTFECTDLEWRISFSMAEKKLIHSMNHAQFLCYGLMKIFLNEVLKKIPEFGELLCSYFFKTAVFWEISEGDNEWSPCNFILNFNNVFRRIMRWVSIGYCPNFFIPEHNMFRGKIYGRQQRELMSRLSTFHDEGYLCLLRCLSIHESLSFIRKDPSVMNFKSINEEDYVSKAEIEKQRLKTIIIPSIESHETILTEIMRNLCNTAALAPTSDDMTSAVKLRMNYMLQRLAVVILTIHHRPTISHTSNRSGYRLIQKAESILKRSKTFLCMNMVHHAVCSYTNCNYNETIQTVHYVQRRLKREPYMYEWDLDGDKISELRQLGMSYESIVNRFIVTKYIYEPLLSIDELLLESNVQIQTTGSFLLFIPTLVSLNFLLILSYTRLCKIDRRNETLFDLYSILHYDDGHHIFYPYKAISWEILGICQQICGDYHYQSYVNALNDKYNEYKEATIVRITILVYKLLNQ